MPKTLIHAEAISIASGSATATKSFTPQSGKVIGFCIYDNNTDGSINDGIVSAKLTTDSNEDIAPMCDIRHYRNRDAAYKDGLVELDLETCGRTYVVTITATANFSDDYKATVVLVYDKDYLN